MAEDASPPTAKELEISDLTGEFHSLRIGEEIPKLQIKKIRRAAARQDRDNLPGVDYRYIIEDVDGKVLTVNSWALWNAIRAALKKANKIAVTLNLKHPRRGYYTAAVVSDPHPKTL